MNYDQCPVTRTLELIGGKWKPIILHYLNESPCRSGELSRLIPHASTKMLTQQLRELEHDGIVQRKVYSQVPPKVEYSLTPRGQSLRPIIVAMCTWALENPAPGRVKPKPGSRKEAFRKKAAPKSTSRSGATLRSAKV